MPVQGGTPKQITRDGKQSSGQDWMSNGKTVAFGSDRSGEYRVWKVRTDAAEPEKTLRKSAVYGDFPIQLPVARGRPTLVYPVLQ